LKHTPDSVISVNIFLRVLSFVLFYFFCGGVLCFVLFYFFCGGVLCFVLFYFFVGECFVLSFSYLFNVNKGKEWCTVWLNLLHIYKWQPSNLLIDTNNRNSETLKYSRFHPFYPYLYFFSKNEHHIVCIVSVLHVSWTEPSPK
jgi:hypothetical protein